MTKFYSQGRGPGLATFLPPAIFTLLLVQEGHLSVNDERMDTKYWLTT